VGNQGNTHLYGWHAHTTDPGALSPTAAPLLIISAQSVAVVILANWRIKVAFCNDVLASNVTNV
jgi:hypothetical protein